MLLTQGGVQSHCLLPCPERNGVSHAVKMVVLALECTYRRVVISHQIHEALRHV